ncbi:hypothetical protein PCANB_001051 [Pneumocystis canis]|nr:hypothetical protein PCANB_001051 [Pneumocystis canis]
MQPTKIAAVERFKCLWTPNKHQVRKRWHGKFNFRAMLYDEDKVLVDDLFMPKQGITSGDEIEFDHHLVSVEDALDTIYSDISSLYLRNQKNAKEKITEPHKIQSRVRKQKQLLFPKRKACSVIKSNESNITSYVSTDENSTDLSTSLHIVPKQIKIQKTMKSMVASNDAGKLFIENKNIMKHEEVYVDDIHEISFSDEEAYDLFSQ